METVASFAAWETFYVIIGSSAAALTGLQFVVIALGAEARAVRGAEILTFSSPNVTHFCSVLLVSAVLSAPWETVSNPAILLGVCGAGGVVYVGVVFRRARRQERYQLVTEDWLWHCLFPLAAYGTLLISSMLLGTHIRSSLFAIGTMALILLFIGIHNSWDAAAYIATERPRGTAEPKQ